MASHNSDHPPSEDIIIAEFEDVVFSTIEGETEAEYIAKNPEPKVPKFTNQKEALKRSNPQEIVLPKLHEVARIFGETDEQYAQRQEGGVEAGAITPRQNSPSSADQQQQQQQQKKTTTKKSSRAAAASSATEKTPGAKKRKEPPAPKKQPAPKRQKTNI